MILGLVGKKRAGKDSFAARLVERHGFVRLAFADALKAVALETNPIIYGVDDFYPECRLQDLVSEEGWDSAKENPEVRQLLQNLGVAMRGHVDKDIWLRPVMRAAMKERRDVVITDVRFPNEAGAVVGAGGKLVQIVRPGIDDGDRHESETALDEWETDYFIQNHESVAALWMRADALVADIRERDTRLRHA